MALKNATLDEVLDDIDKNFIAIRDPSQQYKVFRSVFDEVHEKMKQVDPYYERYSSTINYAGNFSERILTDQLDEFDIDIVVRLPIDYKKITIQNDVPGCVKLNVGNEFDDLKNKPDWETHHKVVEFWQDDKKYLLQNKFRSWMESVTDKAMSALDLTVSVGGAKYNLTMKMSGRAFTVRAANFVTGIVVDIDMIPVIEFRKPRWPKHFRKTNLGDSNKNRWFVIPKPNYKFNKKNIPEQNRCWRLAFPDQEKEIIKDCRNLKPTFRLLKKLRDALEMNAVTSYYLKTLFLWKLADPTDRPNKTYWEKKTSVLFADMVETLYKALEIKEIPYYWRNAYNLLDTMNVAEQKQYLDKVKLILIQLNNNSTVDIAKALLTPVEFIQLELFYE